MKSHKSHVTSGRERTAQIFAYRCWLKSLQIKDKTVGNAYPLEREQRDESIPVVEHWDHSKVTLNIDTKIIALVSMTAQIANSFVCY